jgi:hypothetical protein
MLPTFLGIAAPKAGTTWLYEVLGQHPDVVMSSPRKEVHYFDLHFDRGEAWYSRAFPDRPAGAPAPVAVGEFTPHYLYDAAVPERVRSVPTIGKFVVAVRNPVDRAYSHYRFRRRQDDLQESFEDFLRRDPNAVEWGCYGRHLARWYGEFGADAFLVLPFEKAVADLPATREALARHLGVDAGRFPADRPAAANEGFAPRRRRLWAASVRTGRWLRRHDLDRVITWVKRTGAVATLKRPTGDSVERVPLAARVALWPRFEDDVCRLEELTGLDLAGWRPPS